MNSPEFDAALAKTEYDNAVKSLMAASVLAAKYQGERDALKVRNERQRATLANIRTIVSEPGASLVVTRVLAELDSDLPKGTK